MFRGGAKHKFVLREGASLRKGSASGAGVLRLQRCQHLLVHAASIPAVPAYAPSRAQVPGNATRAVAESPAATLAVHRVLF